eukprot:scaffold65155_cov66-Phaeocystis_antarctica.AAC.4
MSGASGCPYHLVWPCVAGVRTMPAHCTSTAKTSIVIMAMMYISVFGRPAHARGRDRGDGALVDRREPRDRVERDVAADGGLRREAHDLVGVADGGGRELEARARAHGARLLAAVEQQVVHAGGRRPLLPGVHERAEALGLAPRVHCEEPPDGVALGDGHGVDVAVGAVAGAEALGRVRRAGHARLGPAVLLPREHHQAVPGLGLGLGLGLDHQAVPHEEQRDAHVAEEQPYHAARQVRGGDEQVPQARVPLVRVVTVWPARHEGQMRCCSAAGVLREMRGLGGGTSGETTGLGGGTREA